MNDDLARDFLLKGFLNPERKGCPDEETLKALAEDRLAVHHPAWVHVGSCSECFAEYEHYQQDLREGLTTAPLSGDLFPQMAAKANSARVVTRTERARNRRRQWAVAASVAVLSCGGFLAYKHQRHVASSHAHLAATQAVSASVDLLESGTLRGTPDGPTPLRQVYLPAAVIRLAVTLPRFSEAGEYNVLISRDKAGEQIIGRASGIAANQNGKVIVQMSLDLRGAHPGAYFLATVRGADNGTYYYPLQIR